MQFDTKQVLDSAPTPVIYWQRKKSTDGGISEATFRAAVSDGRRRYANHTRSGAKPSDCIQCGQCEAACPQHLPIIESLRLVSEIFEN